MTFKDKIIREYEKLKNNAFALLKKHENKTSYISNKLSKYNIKFKYVVISGVIILAALMGFAIISFTTNSKTELINKSIVAIENGNVNSLDKLMILSNGEKIDKSNMTPIIRFFNSDKSRIENLRKGLSDGKGAYSINIEKKDKLFKDDYFLVVSYKTLKVESNIENTEIFVDGNKSGVVNKTQTVKLISPGIYDVRLENKNDYATLSNSKEVTLTADSTVDIPLSGINININSNVEAAKVYINNEATDTTVKDFKNVGPFPTDGSYNVSLKYKTPFGEVASPVAQIKDMPDIILNIDLKSSQVKVSLNNTIGKFYESVFSAIDLKDAAKISFTTKDAADKVYNDIKENGFILKNVYKLNSSSIDFDKSTIEFVNGVYDANIVANINYNVKKEILGVPVKSTDYEQKFFTKLKYENGKWQVYDIENFSLKTIQ